MCGCVGEVSRDACRHQPRSIFLAAVLPALRGVGATCEIAFEDPDAVVVVETMNNRGGIAVGQRENLNYSPFLRPD
jgi:hypothetical protein